MIDLEEEELRRYFEPHLDPEEDERHQRAIAESLVHLRELGEEYRRNQPKEAWFWKPIRIASLTAFFGTGVIVKILGTIGFLGLFAYLFDKGPWHAAAVVFYVLGLTG